jgi:hypothetical protein
MAKLHAHVISTYNSDGSLVSNYNSREILTALLQAPMIPT